MLLKVSNPPVKPLLIYDGDCHFCRAWIARWHWFTGGRVDYQPSQDEDIARRFPEIPRESFDESVQLILLDGTVLSGAKAVFHALGIRWEFFGRLYDRNLGLGRASEWLYRKVAANRQLLSKVNRWFFGPHTELPRYDRVSWLFLKGLGMIYLIAFVSLWTQIIPLSGENGIAPVQHFMGSIESHAEQAGMKWGKYWQYPTICWFDTSDIFLHWLCGAGTLLAVFVMVGFLPAPSLCLLWMIYLSLCTVCRPWLNFQWDTLLLEIGLIAVFLAPWKWLNPMSNFAKPPRIPILLLRWLLFRLMFASGAVKLLSGDEVWWNLTALHYHYETQPIPNTVAWFFHQFPGIFHKASVGVMFAVELLVPFLIFFSRRLRILGFWIITGFMFLIILTGNYTFFNWLTLLLCLLLLDDQCLPWWLRWKHRKTASDNTGHRTVNDSPPRKVRFWGGLRTVVTAAFALCVAAVSIDQTLGMFRWNSPGIFSIPSQWMASLRSINDYGLFRVMTRSRPEIIIEGSYDGENWLAYDFKYKPGDVERPPPFVAPHQPRLDWQMWFAALGAVQQNPWFVNLSVRLLEGDPGVLGLLESNPFPNRPPKWIRASLFDYHFTTPAQRGKTGDWWTRKYLRLYMPPVALRRNDIPDGQPK